MRSATDVAVRTTRPPGSSGKSRPSTELTSWYRLRGVAWCGVVWCGVVWCGVVQAGTRGAGFPLAHAVMGLWLASAEGSPEPPNAKGEGGDGQQDRGHPFRPCGACGLDEPAMNIANAAAVSPTGASSTDGALPVPRLRSSMRLSVSACPAALDAAPVWSNGAKSLSLTGRGSRDTASRSDLRCRASSHECGGQPEAFKCSLMSPWWPAMALPIRPL